MKLKICILPYNLLRLVWQDRYFERNYLLIHGLLETRKENTDQTVSKVLKEKIGEEITEEDLDSAPWVGKF